MKESRTLRNTPEGFESWEEYDTYVARLCEFPLTGAQDPEECDGPESMAILGGEHFFTGSKFTSIQYRGNHIGRGCPAD